MALFDAVSWDAPATTDDLSKKLFAPMPEANNVKKAKQKKKKVKSDQGIDLKGSVLINCEKRSKKKQGEERGEIVESKKRKSDGEKELRKKKMKKDPSSGGEASDGKGNKAKKRKAKKRKLNESGTSEENGAFDKDYESSEMGKNVLRVERVVGNGGLQNMSMIDSFLETEAKKRKKEKGQSSDFESKNANEGEKTKKKKKKKKCKNKYVNLIQAKRDEKEKLYENVERKKTQSGQKIQEKLKENGEKIKEKLGDGIKKPSLKDEKEVVLKQKGKKKKNKMKNKQNDGTLSDNLTEEVIVEKAPKNGHDMQSIKKKKVKKLSSDADQHVNSGKGKLKQFGDAKLSKSVSPVKSPFNVGKLKEILGSKSPDSKPTNPEPKIEAEKLKKPAQPVPTLRERMREKLNAARFRYLNEQMYTTTGEDSFRMMKADPDSFNVYHQGFQAQVAKWPQNPVERMIDFIKARPANQVVADFGCGDAKIAKSVRNKVHSFDLVAVNESVTACDMASVPLSSAVVDIAVFCLALMGTNIVEFLCEANRVLRPGGILLVAEVKSRFEKIGSFVRKMAKLGFDLRSKDEKNKMFVWFEFNKKGIPPTMLSGKLPEIELAPCVYKKR